MSIIRFPGLRALRPVATTGKRLYNGPFSFTCPSCQTATTFDFGSAIFRSVELHCGGSGCGAYFKVLNPAFVPPTK